MMKKLISGLASAAMLLTGTLSAYAIDQWSYSEDVKVYVNGHWIDNGEYKPIIVNDRTLVRLVPIFDALGFEYEFTDADKSITFAKKGTNACCRFTAESNEAVLGSFEGSVHYLDVPATLQYFDVFYVPIRSFCEMAGLDIEWNGKSRSVFIIDKTAETEVSSVLPSLREETFSLLGKTLGELNAQYQSAPSLQLVEYGYGRYKYDSEEMVEFVFNPDSDVEKGETMPSQNSVCVQLIGTVKAFISGNGNYSISDFEKLFGAKTEFSGKGYGLNFDIESGYEFKSGNYYVKIYTNGSNIIDGGTKMQVILQENAESMLLSEEIALKKIKEAYSNADLSDYSLMEERAYEVEVNTKNVLYKVTYYPNGYTMGESTDPCYEVLLTGADSWNEANDTNSSVVVLDVYGNRIFEAN